MPTVTQAHEGRLALASEVFVNDYLTVMENDEEAQRDLMSAARDHHYDEKALANTLRDEWVDYVNQVAALAEKEWGDTAPATLLIRQMMGNQSISEFDKIAKAICEGKE